MTFVKTDPQGHQGENTWFTPKEIIDCLGPFDLDPCTVSYAPFKTAKEHFFNDLGVCGIKNKWYGDVWLNPPYGKEMTPFIDRFIEHKRGCMLIFARMDNRDVQKLISSGSFFYFLRKRVKFIDKNGRVSSNAGTGSCLVFYDEKYIRRAKGLLEGKLMFGIL